MSPSDLSLAGSTWGTTVCNAVSKARDVDEWEAEGEVAKRTEVWPPHVLLRRHECYRDRNTAILQQ